MKSFFNIIELNFWNNLASIFCWWHIKKCHIFRNTAEHSSLWTPLTFQITYRQMAKTRPRQYTENSRLTEEEDGSTVRLFTTQLIQLTFTSSYCGGYCPTFDILKYCDVVHETWCILWKKLLQISTWKQSLLTSRTKDRHVESNESERPRLKVRPWGGYN